MIEVEQVEVRYASPPMFALLELQFAAAVGFLMSAVPYWLSLEGQSLATIGLLAGTANVPHVWKLLWCPLIDLSPYKRVWYGACAVGTAVLLIVCSALPNPGQNLP
ncbi:MAG: MFS transporter, partial [Myxococcaceae bacterium]